MDFFSEEGYILDPVQNQPAQGAFCLIPHKHHARLPLGQALPHVVQDAATTGHAIASDRPPDTRILGKERCATVLTELHGSSLARFIHRTRSGELAGVA